MSGGHTLQFSTLHRGDVTVFRCEGQLGYTAFEAAMGQIDQLLAEAKPKCVVDLAGVPLISSAGLQVLLKLRHESRGRGGEVALAGANPSVANVLKVTCLNRLFRTFATVDHAVTELSQK